jgi:hypothetical protein
MKRAWEYAKELNISNRELMARARRLGFEVTSFMSQVSEEVFEAVRKDMPNPMSEDESYKLVPLKTGARVTCGGGRGSKT